MQGYSHSERVMDGEHKGGAETPEALNAELLTRIVALEQRIVTLQAELAQHQCGHVAALLAAITANASNAQMDDRDFRKFVRRLVG